MLNLTLQIKPHVESVRPAEAWFLPGESSSDWVAHLCRCSKNQTALKLYLVPRSMEDRRPTGVLVTGIEGAKALPPHAVKLGREGDRLYLPVDAVLDPPLAKEELKSLCFYPVMLWHPVTGLVGFEEVHALTLVDVIASPRWGKRIGARPIRVFPPLLPSPPSPYACRRKT
jgi:hypothetical protein